MTDKPYDPIAQMQIMIDMPVPTDAEGNPDMSMAPPFVRGMNLTGLKFTRVSVGNSTWNGLLMSI